ncbi:MAG: TolC family protein [Planctomycetota bacterium]|jgi:outer membrane protein TolC
MLRSRDARVAATILPACAAVAAFDPAVTADFADARSDSSAGTGSPSKTRSASVGVSVALPTGTQIELEADHGTSNAGVAPDTDDARVGVSVTQPLMRGGSPAANLAVLRQAGLDVRASEYELRGAAEALIADVETAYWDFCLAGERIAIYEESLRLAEKQLEETRVRIEAGKLAGTELAAARAEVASRADALIGARGALEMARIRLLRLLGPRGGAWGEGAARFWSREVAPLDRPAAPDAGPAEVEEHVAKALASRPDLDQARLGVERGDLELVRTRNGLLPRLDLFVNLGRTGYADSFSSAFRDLGDGYDVSAGVALEHTLGNRSAGARQRRAAISRAEAELALANLAQLAQLDVRTAHVAAVTARERIAATAAARTLQEEALRAETEKFRVGKSTTFQVAQAQRDLVSARIAEVEAVVGYLQALVGLYRADGSILERRGVSAPGVPDVPGR